MWAFMLWTGSLAASGTALVVCFVLPFDRLPHMTRTVASANLTVTAVISRWESKSDA